MSERSFCLNVSTSCGSARYNHQNDYLRTNDGVTVSNYIMTLPNVREIVSIVRVTLSNVRVTVTISGR